MRLDNITSVQLDPSPAAPTRMDPTRTATKSLCSGRNTIGTQLQQSSGIYLAQSSRVGIYPSAWIHPTLRMDDRARHSLLEVMFADFIMVTVRANRSGQHAYVQDGLAS